MRTIKNQLKTLRSILSYLCITFLFVGSVYGQSIREIKGVVFEEDGATPFVGVNVAIKGTSVGAVTDLQGNFKINAKETDVLLFSYIGYEKQEITVGNNVNLEIVMRPDVEMLEEVVVTAWGKEKKTTVVGSVSTIRPKELKGPTSNLTTMLSGRVAGLISYQTSGEPGRDNAEFFIRGVGSFGTGKVDPLILINGIESTKTELARVQPDDIEGFSILKDATATSMYGSRGANGVMLITTKSGFQGKTKFNVRYETSLSTNAKDYNLADNITYMELANEATLTRNPLMVRPYDPRKIDKTREGVNPLLYPNNNWRDIMIKDMTQNHRVNANVSGGSEKARFYLSASYRYDTGMLETHSLNDFESNVISSNLEVRSNVDLNLTSSTVASVRINGLFDNLNGPAVGTGSDVFKNMLKANPVAFPAVYPQEYMSWVRHPLFGNSYMVEGSSSVGDLYYNPYASALSGYSEENETAFTAQFELKQDFDFLVEGLKARMMAYTKRSTRSKYTRSTSPFYYKAMIDPFGDPDVIDKLNALNPEGGRDYLSYSEGGKEVWNENWLELSASYDKVLNDVHAIGLTALWYLREKKLSNAGNLERSLPQRNASLSGRVTYAYDDRYMGEFNFGYNASERFNKNNRWGFFPSAGLAWNIKNEAFLEDANFLDKLKARVSYGIVGNDELTDWFNRGEERFFYLDMVNMNVSGGYYGGIQFGTDYGKTYNTVEISRYGNPGITWEKANKSNLALELGLFNSLSIELDLFQDRRKNILVTRGDIPSTMGLRSIVRANIGELKSKGFEASVDYNKSLNKDLWFTVRGTFTFARNEATVYEEPKYPEELSYLSRIGYPWNTTWGYIAERLFIDEEDVANSPQQFGDYMAGDIKYRDVNKDGIIDSNDKVPMGYPTQPEINYGFGFSMGYKDFDFSAFFNGIGRTSFMIDSENITPFVKSGGQVNGLLDVIAKDHWSEDNRNVYAFFPRLSTEQITNNNQSSTWWLRNGSFLKLSTVELGYEPRGVWVRRNLGLEGFRLYASGTNLFKVSKFKMWDVEMKGEGMGYPIQRAFNLGVQLSF